jgi:NitT/TauT family transport system substrate-binding protein
MRVLRVLLVVGVVGGLLGAGCGGASGSGRGAGSERAEAPTASAPAGEAARTPPQALIPVRASFSAFAMSQSPIAIAQEGGYFQEEGLDVTITSILSSAQNTAAILTGEVDVSTIGGIGPIRARLGSSDLVLIGATKPYFAGAIVARPEITSPAELRGKRIGITARGGNTDLMARAVLPRFGLDPDRDVLLFPTGGDAETVAALVSGNIEAGSITPPGDEQARNLGFPNLIDITAARIPYPAAALGTAGQTMATRSDVLERYLRAYAKAVHRYINDKDFALAVAAKFLRSDDPAANEQAYELERSLMQPDLDLPLAAIQSTLDLIKGEDPRAATARPEEFVDLRLVRKLQQSGFFAQLAAGQAAPAR